MQKKGPSKKKRKSYVRLPIAVLHSDLVRVSDLSVLVALASFCGQRRRRCWPSKESLARITGITTRSVVMKLVRLEESGMIRRDPRRGRSSVYDLTAYFKLLPGVTREVASK